MIVDSFGAAGLGPGWWRSKPARARALHSAVASERLAMVLARRSEAAEAGADIDQADLEIAKAHEMVTSFQFDDANEFTRHSLADEDALAPPFDLAVAVDPANLVIFVIAGLRPIRHRSRRGRIKLTRYSLPQRFVRAFLVVMPPERIETRLLRPGIRRRRPRGLLLQRAMHPFVPAVLLRRGRSDEARFNPELEPPSRQPGQTAGPPRPKRRPVIATNRTRQPISPERRLKHRLHAVNRRTGNPHLDQKTAVAIRNRQRIDPLAVQRAKPALKVGRPLIIGCRHCRKRPPLINRPPPALDWCNQSGLLENLTNRRGGRPARLGSAALEEHQQLARPQMRKPPAQRNHFVLHIGRSRVRTMRWRMRSIHKPVRCPQLTPPPPCVKRVPANTISPAQLRYAPVARVVIRQHANALFHPTGLRKWHRRVLPPIHLDLSTIPRSNLSGIYTVYTLSLRYRPLTRLASLR